MAAFAYPVWVFFVRTLDRLGKGLRTGARDAILSDEATPATKGKVFGFHRSMDTFGAVLGPLLALLYLQWYPGDYRTLFLIALAPGLIAIGCSLLLKDKKKEHTHSTARVSFFSFTGYWKSSPVIYRKLTSALLLFTLFNSSDVFLLLKAKEAGMTDAAVITLYIFYNLIFALAAFPLGILADKWGLKKMLLSGLLLFACVYAGMALNGKNIYIFYGLFFLYGLYAAATEGISKAWISNISDKKDTATAIGTFSGFQSICTMLASSLAGLIWFYFGATATFLVSSIMTAVAVILLFRIPYIRPVHNT
ncbi:MAG: MFS transporter [Chitinophagaceae bacterium]